MIESFAVGLVIGLLVVVLYLVFDLCRVVFRSWRALRRYGPALQEMDATGDLHRPGRGSDA